MIDPTSASQDEPRTGDLLHSPLWSALLLVAWVFVLIGLGVGAGLFFPPDEWYDALLKPTFHPPTAWFGPVWTVLYATMGIAAWMVQRQLSADVALRRRACLLFVAQLVLNLAWTPLFFGLHSPMLAFIDICALWIVLLWTVLAFGRVRPLAGYLLLPYQLWVTFALVLNGTLWLMNAG